MSAFDKLKSKYMPHANWLIFDSVTSLWLKTYAIDPSSAQWTNITIEALHYETEAEAQAVVDTWGNQNGRFIGKNPPPH